MNKTLRQRAAACLIGVAGLIGGAHASPAYGGLVFFGDSLSDTGNVLSLTTEFAPSPFPSFPGAQGRFSNGLAWTEYLAAGLGLPGNSNPANLFFTGSSVIPIGPQGGQNFAYGGARTGLGGSAGPTTGLLGQLINWNGSIFGSSLTRPADPDTLYVVLAGANDLRDFRSGVPGAIDPIQVATNVTNAVALLAQAGARHFLLSNLPDLGKTPEAVDLGVVPESTAATLAFNAALAASVTALDSLFLTNFGVDLDMKSMDFFGMFNNIYDDALNNGAAFGITNVTTACIAPVAQGAYFFPGSVDINCGVSAFSDNLHPSAAAHFLLGQLALQTVPEPSSIALVVIALISLTRVRKAAQINRR